MLDIIYYSNVTETTHRFVNRLNPTTWGGGDVKRIPLKGDLTEQITNPYVLIIPTYGGTSALERRKHVVPQIIRFLNNENNRKHCVGVVACGNRNFGVEYGRAGNIIAEKLGVPLLQKVELSGDNEDLTILEHTLARLTNVNEPHHAARYTLEVSQDGDYLYINIPEINYATQANNQHEVEYMGRDLIATVLDIDPNIFDITIKEGTYNA